VLLGCLGVGRSSLSHGRLGLHKGRNTKRSDQWVRPWPGPGWPSAHQEQAPVGSINEVAGAMVAVIISTTRQSGPRHPSASPLREDSSWRPPTHGPGPDSGLLATRRFAWPFLERPLHSSGSLIEVSSESVGLAAPAPGRPTYTIELPTRRSAGLAKPPTCLGQASSEGPSS
jgi:hypothetical protein